MAAQLRIAIISIAALALLAAACGEGDNSPSPTATSARPTKPTFVFTPRNTPTIRDGPASQSDEFWDAIAARVSANLSPVLRPPAPPEGFDTVHIAVNDGYFVAAYSGQNKSLRMHVGGLSNPGLPTQNGHQETIYMRGVDCSPSSKAKPCPYLQVKSDADPKEFSFLLWYEPGHEVFPGAADRDAVEYYVIGEGVEPQFLIDFASSLTKSGRAETPRPVTRIPIPWTTTPDP
jgi:hypothetical protein